MHTHYPSCLYSTFCLPRHFWSQDLVETAKASAPVPFYTQGNRGLMCLALPHCLDLNAAILYFSIIVFIENGNMIILKLQHASILDVIRQNVLMWQTLLKLEHFVEFLKLLSVGEILQWVKTEDGEDREWERLQLETGKRINRQYSLVRVLSEDAYSIKNRQAWTELLI